VAINAPTVTWEYTWLSLMFHKGVFGAGAGWDKQASAQIEEHGRLGFELVTAAPVVGEKGTTQFILFFKRRIG
jgi:hypothetical protein